MVCILTLVVPDPTILVSHESPSHFHLDNVKIVITFAETDSGCGQMAKCIGKKYTWLPYAIIIPYGLS